MNALTAVMTLDAKGLSCPLPIVKTAQAIKQLLPGDVLEVLATDPGSVRDFDAWCVKTGNSLLGHTEKDGVHRFMIKKG